MTVINHKSISGITSITAPAGSDDLLTVHTNDTSERFRILKSGAIVTGVATASNFKTGTTNVHSVGVEAAAINVLGADTPIGTGATIYNSGAAVFTGVVTATSFKGSITDATGYTTINNNANYRIISGDANANELNAEPNLTYNGSTVAIHQGSPNSHFKLDIGGHANVGGDVALPTTNRIYWGNSDTAFIKGEHGGSAYLSFGANNEKMRLTRSGNLGIGTNNPLSVLHVREDTFTDITIHSERTSGNIGGINFRKGGVVSGIMTAQYFADTGGSHYFHSQGSQRLKIASDGDLLITGSDNAELKLKCGTSTGNNVIAFLNSSGTTKGNIFYDSDNNFMVFKTDGTASSNERLRITSGGVLCVGATAADGDEFLRVKNKLLVMNTANTGDAFVKIKAGEAGGAVLEFESDEGDDYADLWRIQNAGDSKLGFRTKASGSWVEKLCITSTGVIGVNNTTPDGKGIDVSHGRTNAYSGTSDSRGLAHIIARNTSDAPGRFASISLVNGGGTQAEGSINLVQTANYTGDITFKSRTGATSWTEKLRIASNGQIRMNTAGTPQADLHVGGTGAALNAYFVTSRSSGAYHHYALGQSGASLGYIGSSQQISASGQAVGFAFRSEGHIELCTGGSTEQVRLLSNGRMGVGTNAPEAVLHPRANSAHGTDTAFQVGTSNRFFRLTELSGQDNFSQCYMQFYDNSLREILTLENSYAALANMGMAIVFRGHGGGQTGSVRAYNPSVNTTSGSVLHLTSENNNAGLKISSSQVTVVGSVLQVANFQIRDGGFSGTWDTGITVNQSNAGGCFIFMCCKNWDANDSTASGMYLVRCGYSGNQEPQVWHVSGNNSWTISRNTSNHTLQINGGSGNQRVTILWTT